jgi:hypothetical protein
MSIREAPVPLQHSHRVCMLNKMESPKSNRPGQHQPSVQQRANCEFNDHLVRSISDTERLQINFQAASTRAQLSLSNAILRLYCRQACSLRWRCMESLPQETECGNQCICHQCGNQCSARFCLGDSCCHQGARGQSVLNANKNYNHEDFKYGCLVAGWGAAALRKEQ